MLRAFNNYTANTDYTNFSGNFIGLQIQKSLTNSVNITNGTFGGKSTFYSLCNGYISPNQTDTDTFISYSDDSANMYINDTVFLSCSYTSAAQVGTIVLTAGNWYPFMIESVQGNGGENVNVSYKGTGQNYVSFAHSINSSFAFCNISTVTCNSIIQVYLHHTV